jgi:hypothetical protein
MVESLDPKSLNHMIRIMFCDSKLLANTGAPQVLHLSIIRPVFVGLSVAIELQNRQYTIRSHGSIRDNSL